MAIIDFIMIAVVILGGILVYVIIKLINKSKLASNLTAMLQKYQGIINIEEELQTNKGLLANLKDKLIGIEKQYGEKEMLLNQEYLKHKAIYDSLLNEVTLLEENLENISYGLYRPHYDFQTSDEYKLKLSEIIDKQKLLIKDGKATLYPKDVSIGNSRSEGAKLTKHYSKLMLRAFNGECTAAISRVKWNNITNMEGRIINSCEDINKLGSTLQIIITNEYYRLKIEELRLEYELQEKLFQEKEEQRAIRERMREEEKAQREFEKAQKEAEEEEIRNERALQKAKEEIEKARGDELEELNSKIKMLENNLQKVRELKQRAMSQAQLTKSGYVYIISNIGSFGDSVYKVGMTRRLEPMDRIYELGDASVPFDFDVHALIYSDNAPELENTLHKRLELKRINMIDKRAEFFETDINEIESIVNELNLKIPLIKIAEAKEYRESLSIKNCKRQPEINMNSPEHKNNKFPDALF
jgi:hypothetical protein